MFKKLINKISGYFYFKTLDIEEKISTHTNIKPANMDLKGLENILHSIELLVDNNLPQGRKAFIIQKGDIFRTFDFPSKVDVEAIKELDVIPPEPPKNGLSKEAVENLKKFFDENRTIGV